jgi:hypothetical protein
MLKPVAQFISAVETMIALRCINRSDIRKYRGQIRSWRFHFAVGQQQD